MHASYADRRTMWSYICVTHYDKPDFVRKATLIVNNDDIDCQNYKTSILHTVE